MDDEQIISLLFRRDETAISETDLKYGRLCRAAAKNITGTAEDGEECVSDTYLALWNTVPPTHPLHLCAYLMGILRRLCLERVRYRCADRRGGGEYAVCLEELDECIADRSGAEDNVMFRELTRAVNRLISRLPSDDRVIFLSRYWLCAPIAEISAATGFSESKIKSSLRRSRLRLRDSLTGEGLI